MMAKVIDGKQIAQSLLDDLAQDIAKEVDTVKLAVILVGNDEASQIYVRNKKLAAQKVGIECDVYCLDDKTTDAEVLTLIEKLNRDFDVHGIIVQLPLPEHLNKTRILEAIRMDKDVDAFKQIMAGALWQGKAPWVSATPAGVLYLLKTVYDNLSGLHAVVIGRSNIVGKPMAALLLQENCTVTIAHSKSVDLPDIVRTADIVVAACGCPKLVKKEWVKEGATVIDVGISKCDGKLCGDVDFDDVSTVASAITPVPGGVGPMTIAMLLKNTYSAYLEQMDRM